MDTSVQLLHRLLFTLCLFAVSAAYSQETKVKMENQTISGPASRDEAPAWLAEIKQWRKEKLASMKYNGSEYERPELKWTQRSFIQSQMMVEDRFFYDVASGKYTVGKYLDDLQKRYGGIDAVLIWAVYCNIGIDNRNQHDMVRALPGGYAGVRQVVRNFHRRGVQVFFPVMPWDVGTRDEGVPLWTAIANTLKEVGADGINGDTITGIPIEYRKASDEIGHIVALEPEVGLRNEAELPWNTMSWGYWGYQWIPVVSKYKWLEPRHMVNVCNRWARNRTDDLQHAFFNGTGYESWENIWGIWNGITPRDGEAIRRMATIERAFPDLLASKDWEPHSYTLQPGVFSSKFPGAGATLWTLVNRHEYDIAGPQLRIPHRPGVRYFDLWHGVELTAGKQNRGQQRRVPALAVAGENVELSFEIEGRGFGAVLATDDPDGRIRLLLAEMQKLGRKRLAEFFDRWEFLAQKQTPIKATKPAKEVPGEMVLVPGAEFEFKVSGIEIEGFDWVGLDVQYPWENSPRRHHREKVSMKPFYIDRYPVTNARFKQFIDATRYRPRDDYNFLKDWKNGTYPEGWANKPVTWVSLEDARAYAQWAGKRLPHEWEWQYAAQGLDRRIFPWGNDFRPECVPPAETGRSMRAPTDVDAYPSGASPFGAMDMVGNVWQWTDEYQDEHTRSAILRGGSYYRPQGSGWYFPNTHELIKHGKLLLVCPGKDRAGTLGFRCVVDAE